MAMLCRGESGWGSRGGCTCGGEGGRGGDVAGGRAQDCREPCVSRAEDGDKLSEECRPVGNGQERGRAARGGSVPHAKHAEPQLGRGAGEWGCGDMDGEEHFRRGGAEFEGGDEVRGVTCCGHQHWWVREQGTTPGRVAGQSGGVAVVVEVGLGVQEGAVTQGAGHSCVAGGVALGVHLGQVHDAMKGQCGGLCFLVGEAEQVRGPAWGVRPQK